MNFNIFKACQFKVAHFKLFIWDLVPIVIGTNPWGPHGPRFKCNEIKNFDIFKACQLKLIHFINCLLRIWFQLSLGLITEDPMALSLNAMKLWILIFSKLVSSNWFIFNCLFRIWFQLSLGLITEDPTALSKKALKWGFSLF